MASRALCKVCGDRSLRFVCTQVWRAKAQWRGECERCGRRVAVSLEVGRAPGGWDYVSVPVRYDDELRRELEAEMEKDLDWDSPAAMQAALEDGAGGIDPHAYDRQLVTSEVAEQAASYLTALDQGHEYNSRIDKACVRRRLDIISRDQELQAVNWLYALARCLDRVERYDRSLTRSTDIFNSKPLTREPAIGYYGQRSAA